MKELIKNAETINRLLARYGVKFGIYKDGTFKEQLFPFDPIPRIISNGEFQYLEKGLKQRVNALNCFLSDIYGEKRIVRDGVIPEEFIYSAKGFLPPCDGVTPPKNIYSHISGIDLVQSKDDNWYILEDNLRVPSGASYPMIARELQRRSAPDAFSSNSVIDNRNYADMLKEVMDYVNTGGINVILSPGRYNAAFFEHSYLAEKTGAVLSTGKEIVCENDRLYYIDYLGRKQRVGAVYRRISDEYLDPMTFYEDSVIGIPHIFEAYKKGLKNNFRLFLLYGVFIYMAFIVSYYSILLYFKIALQNTIFFVPLFIAVLIALFLLFMSFSLPILTVTFRLELKYYLKNAALMAIGELPMNFYILVTTFVLISGCVTFSFITSNVILGIIVIILNINHIYRLYPKIEDLFELNKENDFPTSPVAVPTPTDDEGNPIMPEISSDDKDGYVFVNGMMIKKSQAISTEYINESD